MTDHFMEAEIARFREAFSYYDKAGNGRVSTKDIVTVMRSLGEAPTDAEFQDMLKELNIDEHGTVDFSQFLTMMARGMKNITYREEEMRKAFKVIDRDGNGFISVQDLRHMLTTVGAPFTPELAEGMVRCADSDGDGQVSFEDFARVLCPKN